MNKQLVKDLMTGEIITVTPKTSLKEAHRLMNNHRIRRLPVVDRDQVVGIITLGDVREAEPSGATSLTVWEINYLLSELTVQKVMTRNPTTVSPDDTVARAAGLMLEGRISGLPVVDDKGKIVGIISEADIFRYVVQEWGQTKLEQGELAVAA